MDNSKTAQQAFWIEFINLYKSKPVLWKYGSEVYKDRIGKKHAYLDLVEKMREIEPNPDVDMVKKKINSFRACYRRLCFNAQEQIKVGEQPQNRWVYFKHFKFLNEIYGTEDQDSDKNNDEENEDEVLVYMPHKSSTSSRFQTDSTSSSRSLNISLDETLNQSRHISETSFNMTLNTKENQNFWIEFIKLYKSKPELWKVNSEVYKDRKAKKYAYIELVEKLREVHPNPTAEMVRKKINILRTSYRKELHKMERAIRVGRKPVNNWLYFDHFSFLNESKDPLEEADTSNEADEDNDDYGPLDNTADHMENTDFDAIDEEISEVVEFSTSKNSTKLENNSQPSSPAISMHEKQTVSHELNQFSADADVVSLNLTKKQKFWIEFIKLYRSKPELWKCDSEFYKDARAKRSAYLKLLKKMREIYPTADVGMVKRKLDTLCSIYRKLMSKMRKGQRLVGKAADQLIYFKYLSFLNEQNDPLDDKDDDWNDSEFNKYSSIQDNMSDNNLQDDDFVADEHDLVVQFLTTKESTKRQYSPSPTPNHNESAQNEAANMQFKKCRQYSDEADILGISWAYQYRSLSQTQKIFAKKAIDDILFEARLETLQRNSVRINERGCDRCKHT
ncbi:PREDICTED: uncharacterized protein LOC108969935 isoform X1 [Bactrocera latifrons]|uniref:uncharacterized protein LOC108969935 isoform X1 n=1 Tax=Bactrocera latifrons TaxID=174628 RepID=UPI0008DE3344|nr:PREDICTED: uncharacterized protein LOC108969935 isoform X1 [Bactrocera latifrons]